jgi:hypothetical protein
MAPVQKNGAAPNPKLNYDKFLCGSGSGKVNDAAPFGSDSTKHCYTIAPTGESLNLTTPNPVFKLGFIPFYITNARGEPRVKPGVWRPEMWAQIIIKYLGIHEEHSFAVSYEWLWREKFVRNPSFESFVENLSLPG